MTPGTLVRLSKSWDTTGITLARVPGTVGTKTKLEQIFSGHMTSGEIALLITTTESNMGVGDMLA